MNLLIHLTAFRWRNSRPHPPFPPSQIHSLSPLVSQTLSELTRIKLWDPSATFTSSSQGIWSWQTNSLQNKLIGRAKRKQVEKTEQGLENTTTRATLQRKHEWRTETLFILQLSRWVFEANILVEKSRCYFQIVHIFGVSDATASSDCFIIAGMLHSM